MYNPPSYLWVLTIAGIIAMLAATCVVLYGGAVRAGLDRRRAVLLAGGAAAVLGGWFAASAVIAGHGWYHTRLGHGVPWLPVAVVGFLGLLLALRRVPVVARTISELPLALVPTVGVPLLLAVHITSVSVLAKARRALLPAAVPLTAAAA